MRWRLKKEIWGTKDKRVSISTIPERALAELNDKAQEQIRLSKEISKTLKAIHGILSPKESAEKKSEKITKGKPKSKALPMSQMPKNLKKDGTS